MSKTTTTARIRPDGTAAKIAIDGSEAIIAKMPLRPMTTVEVADTRAAARATPEARARGSDASRPGR